MASLPFSTCLVLFFGLTVIAPAQAQQNSAAQPVDQQDVIAPDPRVAAPGTYQFIVTPEGAREAFLKDLLVTAEQLRRQHETVYYRISANVTLKVVSLDEICNKDFQPLPEFVIRKEHD